MIGWCQITFLKLFVFEFTTSHRKQNNVVRLHLNDSESSLCSSSAYICAERHEGPLSEAKMAHSGELLSRERFVQQQICGSSSSAL
jgi:hypothetical protein